MRSRKKLVVVGLGLIVSLTVVGYSVPMGTAWTYQGRLMDDNEPANGLYDFEFKLFNDPCAGTQQGSTCDINNIDVIDGYFTVELDFGSNVFNDDARWLEIGIWPSASIGSFTTLSSRQEITPIPYSLYAKTAGSIPNGVTGSGTTNHVVKFTGSNSLGDSALYEYNYHVGIGTKNPRGTFDVDCDGGDIYLDTFSSQVYIGDVRGDGDRTLFTVDDNIGKFTFENGKVGIGTTSPTAKLEVAGNLKTTAINEDTSGNVGIGTTSPQANLHVDGSFQVGSEPNSLKIHGMLLLTGIGTGTLIYITFPDGYTSSNSMVISAEVQGTPGWISVGYHPSSISGSLYYTLTDAIRIWLPDTGFNYVIPYRVLLMKIK